MSGNASYRLANTAVLSVGAVEAPIVVVSRPSTTRLTETYERLGMRSGMLEELAGVRERRWWPEDVTFADAAAMAGAKALAEAGITPAQIGVMINTSVSRAYLEPSTRGRGAPPARAADQLPELRPGQRLPGLRQRHPAGRHDDRRRARPTTRCWSTPRAPGSPRRPPSTGWPAPDATAADVRSQFATLTLGSGAAAMVLGRADRHPEGHRVVGGVSRAGTEHHDLCVGDLNLMRTDSKELFQAGLALALETWRGRRRGRLRLVGHRLLRRPSDLGGAHPGHGRTRSA